MKTVGLENIVWKEDKYYVAKCLNVEVSSFGESKEEALANLQEALELYFEDEEVIDLTPVESTESLDISESKQA
ncbi:type II toxin-antitoxin system HicB family antitoxin [Mucilaginibacter arboris]|uniref:Type II toxin-antitoxin system HicB family antitoxin n=1 Tax=Mucilaginibacter arboris TaxID=2682090 RepID=A0A7K1SU37_9SPHI|nr:type II toxin-antitoxin system HicB family antitoxin [Mucilaginibacter arboris]MVN20777.1 type II toxin-antitoxin system HicB family antitoxin [Mucilaginibacter arboris]